MLRLSEIASRNGKISEIRDLGEETGSSKEFQKNLAELQRKTTFERDTTYPIRDTASLLLSD